MTGKDLKDDIIRICGVNLAFHDTRKVDTSIRKFEGNLKKELNQLIRDLENGKLSVGGILEKKLYAKRDYIKKQFNSYSRKQLVSPCRVNRDAALSYLAKLELIEDLIKDIKL